MNNLMYYYRARYYDLNTGRFISKDPIGFNAGDVNLYRYVGNNPVNYTDPMGLFVQALPQLTSIAQQAWQIVVRGAAVITGVVIGNEIAKDKCDDKKCPPCTPPVGTIGYRYDSVPPSRPHKPYTGDHVHLYKMNQNPSNCQCFWQQIGVIAPPPPPGAVPL